MFDKAVIAEMAFRQSVDHRLSCLPVSYRRPTDFAAFTSLTNHWLAAVASHNYRQGVDHRLSCLPALYRPMNFVTLTSGAELVASVNHRLAAVASQSSEDHYRRPAVALQEEQELLIKHDGKCNQHDTDVEKSLHLLGDVAVAFSLLELKTMNGAARSRMNTNHVSLHYPSPRFSGSALLRWAQATDLQEREASITSTGSVGSSQAFKQGISRTKNNAKKTNAITKLPLKKRAMRRARALRRNTIALSKKKTISNCISIKTVQA